jgi:hypothetical protein
MGVEHVDRDVVCCTVGFLFRMLAPLELLLRLACNILGLYRGLDRQTVTKLDDRQGISP